jgi:hypothetical protein
MLAVGQRLLLMRKLSIKVPVWRKFSSSSRRKFSDDCAHRRTADASGGEVKSRGNHEEELTGCI